MYMVIDKIPIAGNYWYEIITENYLSVSSLMIRLVYNQSSVILTECGFENLCLLKPRLKFMLQKISLRGRLCYYFSQLHPYLAGLILERHYSTTSGRFVSNYSVETYNCETKESNWLHFSKFHFRLLFRIRHQVVEKLQSVRLIRAIIRGHNRRKT